MQARNVCGLGLSALLSGGGEGGLDVPGLLTGWIVPGCWLAGSF